MIQVGPMDLFILHIKVLVDGLGLYCIGDGTIWVRLTNFDTSTKKTLWITELADFNVTLKYNPGQSNSNFPSRTPVSLDWCTEQCSPKVLGAIFNPVKNQRHSKVDKI